MSKGFTEVYPLKSCIRELMNRALFTAVDMTNSLDVVITNGVSYK